jgi:ribosomal protein S18 acetylase RimI-like enzyme
MFEIVVYQDHHFEGVAALWREAFPNDKPWNAAEIAIPEKLRMQPDLLLVALKSAAVVGSVMAGYDGHRGWISRIAVLASSRGQGIGRALLSEAENRLASMGCIKINLQVVTSNKATTSFYEKEGYAVEPRVSMSKLLRNS